MRKRPTKCFTKKRYVNDQTNTIESPVLKINLNIVASFKQRPRNVEREKESIKLYFFCPKKLFAKANVIKTKNRKKQKQKQKSILKL